MRGEGKRRKVLLLRWQQPATSEAGEGNLLLLMVLRTYCYGDGDSFLLLEVLVMPYIGSPTLLVAGHRFK